MKSKYTQRLAMLETKRSMIEDLLDKIGDDRYNNILIWQEVRKIAKRK